MAKSERQIEALVDFKKCLADWLETHRQRIWTGSDESDSLIELLADYGVMLPTGRGMMALRNLLK